MDSGSIHESGDVIVNVKTCPEVSLDEKTEPPKESTWKHGTIAVFDEEWQKKSWEYRFNTVRPTKPFTKLADLSIAYYQHDLEQMEEVLSDNGGVINDEQLRSLRGTLRTSAVKDAQDINRIHDEDKAKEKEDALSFSKGIDDEFVKLLNKIIFGIMFPIVLVILLVWDKGLGFRTNIYRFFNIDTYLPSTEGVARIIAAAVSSATLLVPLIMLSYVEPLKYRLITVCLSVLVFAAGTSILFKRKTSDLIGIVAAYTAVLIVYVGG